MEEQPVISEVQPAPAPVPAAAPKRGETPRQQIHKAKALSRRQFAAEERGRTVSRAMPALRSWTAGELRKATSP